jgi:hypothetical protein
MNKKTAYILITCLLIVFANCSSKQETKVPIIGDKFSFDEMFDSLNISRKGEVPSGLLGPYTISVNYELKVSVYLLIPPSLHQRELGWAQYLPCDCIRVQLHGNQILVETVLYDLNSFGETFGNGRSQCFCLICLFPEQQEDYGKFIKEVATQNGSTTFVFTRADTSLIPRRLN